MTAPTPHERRHVLLERRHELEKAERKARQEWMDQYRKEVLGPALKEIVDECAKLGHVDNNRPNYNLIRTLEWHYCAYCGALIEERNLE